MIQYLWISGIIYHPRRLSSVDHPDCVVHQIRNSCKYVVSEGHEGFHDRYERDLYFGQSRTGYDSIGSLRASVELEISPCRAELAPHRDELTAFFEFPVEIRKIIYTTNIIENLNDKLWKYTKSKLSFSKDDAVRKFVWLASQEIEKKWTAPIHNWGVMMNQFIRIFENRIGI